MTAQATSDRELSGTVLVIDESVPEFDRHAGGLSISTYIRLLRGMSLSVTYLPNDRVARQPYTRLLQQRGVQVLHGRVDFDDWLESHSAWLGWVLVARPDVASAHVPSVRRLSSARLLYYTHDIHFLREDRRHQVLREPNALSESRRLRSVETAVFRTVDCVMTPSTDEVDIIRDLAPGTSVLTVPAFAFGEPPVSTPFDRTRQRDVIFVGGFNHRPNVDSALVIVRDVMPRIWRSQPNVHLMIVGSDPPAEIVALRSDRVTVTGYVPDLAPYFAKSRVSLNPIRFGAGVKGKIVESLHSGVPVVTSSLGNEGLGLVDGSEALIGDTVEDLAAHAVQVLVDDQLAESLSVAGRGFVARNFSETRTREALTRAMGLTA